MILKKIIQSNKNECVDRLISTHFSLGLNYISSIKTSYKFEALTNDYSEAFKRAQKFKSWQPKDYYRMLWAYLFYVKFFNKSYKDFQSLPSYLPKHDKNFVIRLNNLGVNVDSDNVVTWLRKLAFTSYIVFNGIKNCSEESITSGYIRDTALNHLYNCLERSDTLFEYHYLREDDIGWAFSATRTCFKKLARLLYKYYKENPNYIPLPDCIVSDNTRVAFTMDELLNALAKYRRSNSIKPSPTDTNRLLNPEKLSRSQAEARPISDVSDIWYGTGDLKNKKNMPASDRKGRVPEDRLDRYSKGTSINKKL